MKHLKRHVGQKIALVAAVFCTLMALPTFAGFVWLWQTRGIDDTWTPSALTTVFFFLFCAVVLYVLSRPQPPLPVDVTTVDR